MYPEEIPEYLANAGADYSALDPKSGKTSEQLHSEYTKLTKQFYANDAIAAYKQLKKWVAEKPQHPEKGGGLFVPAYVEESLKKAGKGYEIFDPSGKRSAQEIKTEIAGLMKIQGKLNDETLARSLYSDIKEVMPKSADEVDISKTTRMVDSINRYLGFPEGSEKTADYRILDITGKKTAGQMRVEFNTAVKDAQLSIARNAFPEAVRRDEIQKGYSHKHSFRIDYFHSIGIELRGVGINFDSNHNGRISKKELADGLGIKLGPTLMERYNSAVHDIQKLAGNFFTPIAKTGEFAPAHP